MFRRRAEIREKLMEIVEKFRQKGAISRDKAMTVEDLGLPSEFKRMMKGHLGRLGIFSEVNGKYYLSENGLRETKEHIPFRRLHPPLSPPRPLRHWLKYTASVPKGFLRYHALRLLQEKPMSGSEIMEEIEEHTGGRWKPSPGSVYPLLAWFKDNGYVREIPTEETGIKRYMLTEKGEEFFEGQTKLKERLQKKLEFLVPLSFGEFWPEKLREIREPAGTFLRALFNLRIALAENLTDHTLKEVTEFLNSTTEKIEEITKRLASEKSSS